MNKKSTKIPINPYEKNTWTPEEVIQYTKESIKEFGRYTFYDKGPREVMDINVIVKYLCSLPIDDICAFIKKFRGKTAGNSERAAVARDIIGCLDDGPWTEEEFQRFCDASPESY
jgi:hypothetical protein